MTELVVRSLAEREAIIEKGLATFVEVGAELLAIRDERLYRETHGTFEDYCRERWNLSRKRAYDLTAAAEVTAEMSPTGDTPVPSSERVARELAPLKSDPERVREAWSEAVEQHGTKPTAAQVREVVEQKLPERTDATTSHKVMCPTCGHMVKPDDFKRGV